MREKRKEKKRKWDLTEKRDKGAEKTDPDEEWMEITPNTRWDRTMMKQARSETKSEHTMRQNQSERSHRIERRETRWWKEWCDVVLCVVCVCVECIIHVLVSMHVHVVSHALCVLCCVVLWVCHTSVLIVTDMHQRHVNRATAHFFFDPYWASSVCDDCVYECMC